jgi:hypothetical protein
LFAFYFYFICTCNHFYTSKCTVFMDFRHLLGGEIK